MDNTLLANLENVYNKIKKDLDTSTKKIIIDLLYAFNGTGKTRLSRLFTDL